MKKIFSLLIAVTMTAPIFAMHKQVTPMASITPVIASEDIPDVIVVPKRHDQDNDFNLHTSDIECLTLEPFADLISQAHPDYLLARVDTALNGSTHCFDAKSLNAILKPNARDFRPSSDYMNPVTKVPIADAHYYAIDSNNTCTYKCSYNDFVATTQSPAKRSIAEWNALFPDAIVIDNPHPTERDIEAARNTLINRHLYDHNGAARTFRIGAVSTCAGLLAGGIIYISAACASHQCPF
jgi:hypothetical protein